MSRTRRAPRNRTGPKPKRRPYLGGGENPPHHPSEGQRPANPAPQSETIRPTGPSNGRFTSYHPSKANPPAPNNNPSGSGRLHVHRASLPAGDPTADPRHVNEDPSEELVADLMRKSGLHPKQDRDRARDVCRYWMETISEDARNALGVNDWDALAEAIMQYAETTHTKPVASTIKRAPTPRWTPPGFRPEDTEAAESSIPIASEETEGNDDKAPEPEPAA